MSNKFLRSFAILTISLLLILTSSLSVFAAAVKTTTGVTTDRTLQNVQTGVLTYNAVTIPHYASATTISGKVVIDGPKLILKVNGLDVTDKANIVKIADKTWTYSYNYNFNNAVGDIPIYLEAYTIYVNGQPAGNIHTKAAPVTQTVHVPYVKEFGYSNVTWDSYNRSSNLFTFSYQLIKVWDDGVNEIAADKTTATVEGTQTYTISATDPTHNNGAPDTAGTITPPVVFRNFSFPSSADAYTWDYNATNGTYRVSFQITKLWSNGTTSLEAKTIDNLIPGVNNTISITIEGVTNSITVAAPALPVAPEITVTNAVGVVTAQETIAENHNNTNGVIYNNYRVTCYAVITLSNGTVYTSGTFEETFPFNNGNTSKTRNFTRTFTIDGKSYDVTFSLTVQ